MLPEVSFAIPQGFLKVALVAGPPSPENPYAPVPMTVVTLPLVAILWTTLVQTSVTKILPVPSRNRSRGQPNPLGPAIVLIIPVEAVTLRTTLFPPSDM